MEDFLLQLVLDVQNRLSAGLQQAQNDVKKFSLDIGGATKASNELAGKLTSLPSILMGTAGAFGLIKSLDIAGDLQAMEKGFITLLGSAEEASATMERIKQEAVKTPFEIYGLTEATQALALVTKDGDQAIDVLLDVGKALSAAGKGQAELNRIVSNLQQISLTGKITEMDIRQFGMNGVNILELLADYYGVTTAEASEMVKNSSDAFGDLSKAFAKAGGEGGKFANAFAIQMGTYNQALSNAKDSLNLFMADFVKNTGIMELAISVLKSFASALDIVSSYVKNFTDFLKENELAMFVFQGAIAVLAGAIGGSLLLSIKSTTAALWALVSGPLAPFIATGALIGGVVYLIYKATEGTGVWAEVTKFASNVFYLLGEVLKVIFTALNGVIKMLVDSAKWLGENTKMAEGLKGAFAVMLNIATFGLPVVIGLVMKLVSATADASKSMGGLWNVIVASIMYTKQHFWNFIADLTQGLADFVKENEWLFKKLGIDISGNLTNAVEGFRQKALEAGADADMVVENMVAETQKAEAQQNKLTSAVDKTGAEFVNAGNDAKSSLEAQKKSVDDLKKSIEDTFKKMSDMRKDFEEKSKSIQVEGDTSIAKKFGEAEGEMEKAKERMKSLDDDIVSYRQEKNLARTQSEIQTYNEMISKAIQEKDEQQAIIDSKEVMLTRHKDEQVRLATDIAYWKKYYAADEITQMKMDTALKLKNHQLEYLQKLLLMTQELVAFSNQLKEKGKAETIWLNESKAKYQQYANDVQAILNSIKMPSFTIGGVSSKTSAGKSKAVGGDIYETGAYLLHKGERVITSRDNRGEGQSIVIQNTITGNTFMGEEDFADKVGQILADKVQLNLRV